MKSTCQNVNLVFNQTEGVLMTMAESEIAIVIRKPPVNANATVLEKL